MVDWQAQAKQRRGHLSVQLCDLHVSKYQRPLCQRKKKNLLLTRIFLETSPTRRSRREQTKLPVPIPAVPASTISIITMKTATTRSKAFHAPRPSTPFLPINSRRLGRRPCLLSIKVFSSQIITGTMATLGHTRTTHMQMQNTTQTTTTE